MDKAYFVVFSVLEEWGSPRRRIRYSYLENAYYRIEGDLCDASQDQHREIVEMLEDNCLRQIQERHIRENSQNDPVVRRVALIRWKPLEVKGATL